MKEIIPIIMAGGLGKRMNSETPKVLCRLHDKPMLIHVLEKALNICDKHVLIVVGRFKTQIQEEISKYIDSEDIKKIVYIDQPEGNKNGEPCCLGTGHAIKCCMKYIIESNTISHKFIVLSADVPLISDELLTNMCSYSNALVCSRTNNPTGYGRVFFDKEHKPFIIEHKFCPLYLHFYNTVNTGIYIFTGSFLIDNIDKLEENSSGETFLTDLPFEEFIFHENFSIFANVNTKETLEQLNQPTNVYIPSNELGYII